MRSKLFLLTLSLFFITLLNMQGQQLNVNFSSEMETFITSNFYKKQGKNLGTEKGTRHEINESLLKIKDFKTLLYNDFATYYAISEYQKKGSEAIMDEMNAVFMTSKIVKYRVDSKNKTTILTEEEKKKGIVRKIELQNTLSKVLAIITLDTNNKIIIRFTEQPI